MKAADHFITSKLAERKAAGNYRALKATKLRADFCSNDYLGFARSEEFKTAADQKITIFNPLNGSTGSRLISGNLTYTEELERLIADTFNAEAALLFNSGYDANLGLLSSLPQRGDTIICDELIHASAIDGARLSYANRFSFKHNDVDDLERKIKNAKGIIYIVVESVYSMDGDTAPLAQIVDMAERYHAHLIVDEAHGVGIYKKGLVCHLGLEDKVFARVITFGKALGCHGAVVAGSELLRNYLINFARSFIYTTAAPFHQVAAIKTALDLLERADKIIDVLKDNINLFKNSCSPATIDKLVKSESPIQCLVLKSNQKARSVAASLQNNGLDVRAILSPTVAAGSERLRICLHAFNTKTEIIQLAETLNLCCNEE